MLLQASADLMLLTFVTPLSRISVIAIPSKEQAIHARIIALRRYGALRLQNTSIVKNIEYAQALENVL